jgi:hypothetical protein
MAAGWRIRDSNAERGERFLVFSKDLQTDLVAHPAFYSVDTGVISRR